MQRFSIIHPATRKHVVVVVEADVERQLAELPSSKTLRQIIERLDRIEEMLRRSEEWLAQWENIRETVAYSQAEQEPEHVCGKQGFGRGADGINDRCLACEQESGNG